MSNDLWSEKLRLISLGDDYEVMGMNETIRYNQGAKHFIRKENLAEHSFHVSANILKIGHILGLPENIVHRAVVHGLVHDISEPLTADLPYEFKSNPNHQELMEKFTEYELEQVQTHYPWAYEEFKAYTEDNGITREIVDLADALTVRQATKLEKDKGNKTDEVEVIYTRSKERIEKHSINLLTKLKKDGII